MPDKMLATYNEFVDKIYARINKVLKDSYDPVNVSLNHEGAEVKSSGSKKSNKKYVISLDTAMRCPETWAHRNCFCRRNSSKKNKKQAIVPSTAAPEVKARSNDEVPTVVEAVEETEQKEKSSIPATPINNKKPKRKSSSKKHPSGQKKQSNNKQAKATLYGLSSLKRVGDVKVSPMAEYTTVKSNFVLGPLMLKVEKTSGRNEKRDIRMATATTHEIYGKINIRVVNGEASLHSIKVQQPKQVKVDSPDNHDRTRQYVWKKSSSIARVVSQKLRNAANSMIPTAH